MPNWLRALIAGYGAKKLGGGCFSTILVFIVIWYALGTCNKQQPRATGYNQPAASSIAVKNFSKKPASTIYCSVK